jgi:hypothetical protein
MLKRDPEIAKKLGATIVVTDETQKFKNERNQRSNALREAGDAVGVERPNVPTRTAWGEKFGQLERGYEHITREDKVRQFREGIDDRLFHMSAPDAGNDLPGARKGDKDAVDRLGFPHTRHDVSSTPSTWPRSRRPSRTSTRPTPRRRPAAGPGSRSVAS